MKRDRRLLFFRALLLGLCGFQAASAHAKDFVQNGDKVSIHYVLKVDRQVADSSAGKKPMTYVQGSGQIIPGLDEQILGMKRGAKKHVTVLPAKGYGEVDSEAYQNVPRKSFRDSKDLKVGGMVTGSSNGQTVRATVLAIDKDTVTLNLNHPLAGKKLEFDVEVVDIQPGK